MERVYEISIKVLSRKELYNFRISVDENNFDDFKMEIEIRVLHLKTLLDLPLTIKNFSIYYTGMYVSIFYFTHEKIETMLRSVLKPCFVSNNVSKLKIVIETCKPKMH